MNERDGTDWDEATSFFMVESDTPDFVRVSKRNDPFDLSIKLYNYE